MRVLSLLLSLLCWSNVFIKLSTVNVNGYLSRRDSLSRMARINLGILVFGVFDRSGVLSIFVMVLVGLVVVSVDNVCNMVVVD